MLIVLFYSTREYNSGLPSSAACERLLSTAGLIFTAKRCNLSDLNFEMLLFLKLNGAINRQKHLETTENNNVSLCVFGLQNISNTRGKIQTIDLIDVDHQSITFLFTDRCDRLISFFY
jgi:hypothetical protein